MGKSRQGKGNRLGLARLNNSGPTTVSGRSYIGLVYELEKEVGRGSALDQLAWEKAGSRHTGMQGGGKHFGG